MNRWTAAISGKGGIYLVAFALTAAFVALRVWDPLPLQILRLKAFDQYQRYHPRERDPNRPAPVVIVDLDEESLQAKGQWPWPRTLVAQLVDNLTRYQVAAIGFDIVFAETDRTSPAIIAPLLPGLDPETRDTLAKLPSNDRALAAAIKRNGRAILGQSTLTRSLAGGSQRRSVKTTVAVKGVKGVDPRDYAWRFAGLVRNLGELEDAAAGIGVFTLKPEIDGVVRRVPMVMRVGKELYPALTVEMLRVALGKRAILVVGDKAGIKSVKLAKNLSIPTDSSGRAWVNYARHSRNIYVSAKDVLDGTVPPERLAGKLALIGTSAVGLLDIKSTPVDDAIPGVEVHAQLIETVLANDFLYWPNYIIAVELAVLLGMGLMLTVLIVWAGAVWGLFAGGSVVTGLLGLSWYLYVEKSLLLGVAYIAVAGFLLYSILTYLKYVNEEAQRRQVRDQFAHFMAPDLVDQLAEHPEKLELGGEMKDMTLLFCDIRGFTGISEQYKGDPQGLTSLINRFLTPMTNLILDRHGTIDKYMGDCIMAFWNAPLDDADHPRHACASALAMMRGVKTLNEELEAEAEAEGRKYIPIKIGIGLNSGECCVGNMGSEKRFDYSVLGDDVNLASRLEGQSKTYGVDIIIGENTYRRVKRYAGLELDLIQVKGKKEAVRIFALLGEAKTADSPEFKELTERHDAMLAAYRGQRWQEARKLVSECRKLNGHLDGLYNLYDERLTNYEADPPDPDWDGVFIAETK